MRALRTFQEEGEAAHKNGEEWLITLKDTDAHIPNVYEEVCHLVKCQGFVRRIQLCSSIFDIGIFKFYNYKNLAFSHRLLELSISQPLQTVNIV